MMRKAIKVKKEDQFNFWKVYYQQLYGTYLIVICFLLVIITIIYLVDIDGFYRYEMKGIKGIVVLGLIAAPFINFFLCGLMWDELDGWDVYVEDDKSPEIGSKANEENLCNCKEKTRTFKVGFNGESFCPECGNYKK